MGSIRSAFDTTIDCKYWEMIADKLHREGWLWGGVRFLMADGDRMWVINARKDGRRFIVHADDLLAGFLELEAAIAERARSA